MLLVVTIAVAAELGVWVPDGAIHVGERARVGLYCSGCTVEVHPADVHAAGAELRGVNVVDGGMLLDLAGVTGTEIVLGVSGQPSALTVHVPVTPLPGATVALSVVAEAALADGSVRVHVAASGSLDPADLVLRASEGTVGGWEPGVGGLDTTVTFAPERVARPLMLAVSDLRAVGTPPAVATVRLRAHHTATVAAERGTRLGLRIGGRSYGPFVAGPEGSATVSFDALPGEGTYELSVTDDLGNTARLTQAVPTASRPALVAVEGRGPEGGELWLAAASPTGAPWTGPPPSCRTGASAAEGAVEVARARWRWGAGSRRMAEPLVGCSLGEANVTLRLPAAEVPPAAIGLRFYPDVLSADFPLAEVQASLIDEAGERLPITGLEITAAHGVLRMAPAGDALRGDYDGAAAAAFGEDELRARWSRALGSGAAERIELCTARGPEGSVAVARVLDRHGGALAGSPVSARAGGGPLPDSVTDSRGYARWLLPEAVVPRVIRVVGGGVGSETLAHPKVQGDPGCIRRAEPDRADLDARVRVPIRTGRVRQVFVETVPRTLTLGPGASAEVHIRMLDAAGALVRDEGVEVTASEGVMSPPVVSPAGEFVSTFSPGAGASARDVRITAKSSAGTVVTTLSVAPRPVRGMVAAGFGWVDNFGAISSPYGSLALEPKLPWSALSARVGVAAYGLDAVVSEPQGEVSVVGTFFPVDVGVSLADRGPRITVGAGLSLVLVPFTMAADYVGSGSISGPGLAPPGVEARGSVGWRLGQTELYAEVGYLVFAAPEGPVSLAQNAGGLHLIAGYRLLY